MRGPIPRRCARSRASIGNRKAGTSTITRVWTAMRRHTGIGRISRIPMRRRWRIRVGWIRLLWRHINRIHRHGALHFGWQWTPRRYFDPRASLDTQCFHAHAAQAIAFIFAFLSIQVRFQKGQFSFGALFRRFGQDDFHLPLVLHGTRPRPIILAGAMFFILLHHFVFFFGAFPLGFG